MSNLVIEALVVGIFLTILFMIVGRFMPPIQAVFVSGMLFHIICEFTGVNAWYVRSYKF